MTPPPGAGIPSTTNAFGTFPSAPAQFQPNLSHFNHHIHQPPPSTVVVTNETSPAGSLESYEGDI